MTGRSSSTSNERAGPRNAGIIEFCLPAAETLESQDPRSGRCPSPLPEKIALILQESRWLALVVLAGFLSLALFGYHADDPGWSRCLHQHPAANPAGRAGAWVSDLLLYLFGVSAWWWVMLCAAIVWWGYRRLDGLRQGDRRPMFIALIGFFVLLVSSSALEYLRFTR